MLTASFQGCFLEIISLSKVILRLLTKIFFHMLALKDIFAMAMF